MPRTKTTESLQAILPRFINNMKGKKDYQMHLMFYNWEKIVGPQIAMHVKPVRMDFRTLFLNADSPAWSTQLKYMERELIDKINGFVATELVTSIRYTNFIIKEKQIKKDKNDGENEPVIINPEGCDIEKAASACGSIKDEDVRKAAERAFAKKEAADRDKRKKGCHVCADCGVLCPPGKSVCGICERKRREKEKDAIRRAILKKPWCSYAELYESFHCSPQAAMEQRLELIRSLSRRVKVGDETSEDARKIVMLKTLLPPEKLTEEKIHEVLGRMSANLIYDPDAFRKKKKPEGRRFTPRKYERKRKE
ncbi:MAG: DUF721 domain-containing protein [Schwartzia sp.]|nr:DUF721 domain-containing protein [Schwartzia sp. (in: firmicutes)]